MPKDITTKRMTEKTYIKLVSPSYLVNYKPEKELYFVKYYHNQEVIPRINIFDWYNPYGKHMFEGHCLQRDNRHAAADYKRLFGQIPSA